MYIISNVHFEGVIYFLTREDFFLFFYKIYKTGLAAVITAVWYLDSTASRCPQSHSHREASSPPPESYRSSCSVRPSSTLGTFAPAASSWKEEKPSDGCSRGSAAFYERLTCLCWPRCRRPACETPWCNEPHQQADAQSPSSASEPCVRHDACEGMVSFIWCYSSSFYTRGCFSSFRWIHLMRRSSSSPPQPQ